MGTPYVVQEGDYLAKIARDQGYDSWEDIYYHPDNAEFRRRRPDPNRIYPGDVIILPDRDPEPEVPPEPPPETPPETPPGGKVVIASEGDSFCSLAHENGFRNCEKVRAANPAIANRQLRPGDLVIIPPIEIGEEEGATEQRHRFRRLFPTPAPLRSVWRS